MNCANHADASAVAYCRTCGKALCANCTRPVRGVIYCEDCLGARMENATPTGTPAFTPVPGTVPPPPIPPAPFPPAQPGVGSGPNPALAGILAGFFPFGVGAVYTGQYAKGLAHLLIFGLLVAGCSVGNSTALPIICGISIAFFILYQIFDAVRSAKAIQMGQPTPDPFGLSQTFQPVDRIDPKRIPTGAVVLILIGIVFLAHTLGLWEFGFDRFWPLILIIIGGWLLARNLGLLGDSCASVDPRARARRLMGPVMLLTIGTLFLLESLHVANFDRTWPIILLAIGGVKLLQSSGTLPGAGPSNVPGAGTDFPAPPAPPPPPTPPVPPSEVSHG
jgi:hypothetical protein